jgi:hypothetical protein
MWSHAVTLDRAESFGETAIETWTSGSVADGAVEGDDSAAAGNEVDQALEGGFNGIEIFVDIGVIEFDSGEDDGVRKIMKKFRTFVEEGSVVFVAFEDEMLTRAEMETGSEVFSDASDEKRRIEAGGRKYPREH